MNGKSYGMTLVELLIAVAISAGLVVSIANLVTGLLRIERGNSATTDAERNATAAAALFLTDFKNAGYRGGSPESFSICDSCSPSERQLQNWQDISTWPFTIDVSLLRGVAFRGMADLPDRADPFPYLVHQPGIHDSLAIARILTVNDLNPSESNVFALEFIYYSLDPTDIELTRLRQKIVCDGVLATGARADSHCVLEGGNSGRQPAIDGMEDLHFFFKLRQADPISGQAIYTEAMPSNLHSVASIGVYFRVQSDVEADRISEPQAFPNPELLPRGLVTRDGKLTEIRSWLDLGIPSSSDPQDSRERVETVQEIALVSSPNCTVLPLAWPNTSVGQVGRTYSARYFNNSDRSDGFGWLSWSGESMPSKLTAELHHPQTVERRYRNPLDLPDTFLNVGDGVSRHLGEGLPDATALQQYVGLSVVVSVWQQVLSSQSETVYRIQQFAHLLVTEVPDSSTVKGIYLGDTAFPCNR